MHRLQPKQQWRGWKSLEADRWLPGSGCMSSWGGEHWETQAWEDDEERGPNSTWNEAMGSGSAGTDDKQTQLLQS